MSHTDVLQSGGRFKLLWRMGSRRVGSILWLRERLKGLMSAATQVSGMDTIVGPGGVVGAGGAERSRGVPGSVKQCAQV